MASCLFFSKKFLDVENLKNRGKHGEKIGTMPRDAPRREVFGRGLGLFIVRRGGFKINFEWAQKVKNIRVF